MHIHHVAIWAQDLEALKAFYCTLFGGQANERVTVHPDGIDRKK